jgi:hypothetical protein
MGILDEAIREHLELKRQHGAGDNELRELEDEAFGPPARPGAAVPDALGAEAPTTIVPADSPAASEQTVAELAEPPAEPVEPLPEPAQRPPAESVEAVEEPAEAPVEEHPAMEHRAVDPSTADEGTVGAETEEHPPPEPPEESQETPLADQPTEFYDQPVGADEGEPLEDAGEEAVEEEEAVEDEFFSEQSLSDELDQALDTPETEGASPPPDLAEPDSQEEELPAGDEDGYDDDEEEGEDVLEETPEFLQDTPEHDRLWFEQKPPKDFDFDD